MAKRKNQKGTPGFDFHSIKTVEDAFKKCGQNIQKLEDLTMIPEKYRHSIWSAFLLMVVFDAINDGWEPDFSNHNEARYFPWPWVLSSGFGFSDSRYTYASATAYVGSRLCTNSAEKTKYVLVQFEDLWKSWLLGMNCEIKFE
jgi:hypothetical protein